jgi:hypothetical protein
MLLTNLRTLSVLTLALFLLSACNLTGGGPAATQVSVDAIYTQAAQTLEAQLTQNAAAQPTLAPTDTPQPIQTQPLESPTPASTDTPPPPPTSSVPLAVIDTNSNCRKGPSTQYDPPIALLKEGQKAEIAGRNQDRSWWYVQIPDRPGQYCWVWGNNVHVEGDASGAQVVAPPPVPITPTFTPKPDVRFDPSFHSVHDCDGEPFAIFEIDNIGEEDFESMSLKIEDTDDEEVIYEASSDEPFMDSADLCPDDGDDSLDDGDVAWIGGDIDDGESGNDAEATITLCTEEGLKGTCVSDDVDFVIP